VHMLRRVIDEAILIPLGSVISLETGYRVYVVQDGNAQPRDVKLGMLKGRDVQVTAGLSRGDKLIIRGHYYVGPGQAVRVIGQGDQIEPDAPVGKSQASAAAAAAERPAGGDAK